MGVRDGRPRFTALFVSLPSASFLTRSTSDRYATEKKWNGEDRNEM